MSEHPAGAPLSPLDIKTTDLSRVYETRKRKYLVGPSSVSRINAVVDLNLEVAPGELFGLLGPNGAGKTTSVKMLCTLLTPTQGQAWVRGLDVVKEANKVRKIVNMVAGGERMLYYRLTGRENLRYFAELYDVPRAEVTKRVQRVLDLVGLADRADDEVEKYSKGMKQRLQIARGIINDPQVLFLDEPTLGLDVDIAKELRSFIRKHLVDEQGKTVLLTTHYLAEAEEMCDRVSFIFKGKVVSTGTPAELSRFIIPSVTAELILSDASDSEIEAFATLTGAKLRTIEILEDDPSRLKKRVVLEVASEDVMRTAFEHFHSRGARVISAALKQPSLEDAYLELARTQAH